MTRPHHNSEIGICIYGAGRWGRNLVRCFHLLGVAVAVVDPDAESRKFVEDNFGIPCFPIDSEIPGHLRSRITAVAIATPAATHTYLSMRAFDQGLDAFVEKPLALNVEDAKLLEAESKRTGRLLMTGHILLYHPAIERLKSLIECGHLGDIRYIYSNRLNLGTVRPEENILWSFAPHDIAVLLHLLDAQPTKVQATGGSWLQPGIKDVTVTNLEFPGGQRAHVFVSWLHPFKEQKLVVVGSKKMAVFDDLRSDAQLVILDAGIDVDDRGMTKKRLGKEDIISLPQREPLLEECKHFVSCCQTRSQPLTDGLHGVNVMNVLARAEADLQRQENGRLTPNSQDRQEETGA